VIEPRNDIGFKWHAEWFENQGQANACTTKGATIMLTRVTKAVLAILVAGLVGASSSTAEAFWGHRPAVVTTGYAPVVAASPVVAAYAPAYATTSYSLPSVPVVVSRPVISAAPVTSYYAPATTAYYAPAATVSAPAVTSYYAPATTSYYAPATTAYYAPAATVAAPAVTSYYAPTASYVAPTTTYYAPAVGTPTVIRGGLFGPRVIVP